jgi:type II secretory pathway pseudopilin PulG
MTITEVLVSISIVGILAALLLMAVMPLRETARNVSCNNNLRQIGLAILAYEATWKSLPPGTSFDGISAHARLLSQLEQDALFQKVDFDRSYHNQLEELRYAPPVLLCPSRLTPDQWSNAATGPTNYIFIAGGGIPGEENGAIVGTPDNGKQVRLASIIDGQSNTAVVTECATTPFVGVQQNPVYGWRTSLFKTESRYNPTTDLDAFVDECRVIGANPDEYLDRRSEGLGSEWLFGSLGFTRIINLLPDLPTNCTNRGSTVSGLYSPSSDHPATFGTVNADGSVHSLTREMDAKLWQALGSINGREPINHVL